MKISIFYSSFQLSVTKKMARQSERGRLVRQRSDSDVVCLPARALIDNGLSRAKTRSMRTSRPRSDERVTLN